MGSSRSATVVCAYLIKYYNLTVSQSINLLKEKRDIVNINVSFIEDLKNFYNCLHGNENIEELSSEHSEHDEDISYSDDFEDTEDSDHLDDLQDIDISNNNALLKNDASYCEILSTHTNNIINKLIDYDLSVNKFVTQKNDILFHKIIDADLSFNRALINSENSFNSTLSTQTQNIFDKLIKIWA